MATPEFRATSKWWYGRITIGNKTKTIRLSVRVDGKRPISINEEGDRKRHCEQDVQL